MADMMAIVSKAVFEKAAGKAAKLGDKLALARYVSANKNLEPLAAGGKLYLVTVRPPNDALWLVAVLDRPTFDGTQWSAAASDVAITDISGLKTSIQFESGKGMSAAPGALGMSLQTPRALTAGDVALLEGALGGAAPAPAVVAAAAPAQDRAAMLLAAVLANPDDAGARLVYADELMSRGDPRGELVQADLALAGAMSIRKREQLVAWRASLVEQHAAAWWPYAIKYRVARGSIEAITGTLAEIKAIAGKLFAAEPVVDVTVLGIDGEDDAKELAKCAWLARVRRLVVRGALGDDGFAALVGAKHAAGLTSLNVTASELSGEGLAQLKSHLPACRTLVLTSNQLGDEGIAGLRAWKHAGKLETLYLANCGLSSEGVAELVQIAMPKLGKLSLSHNELDDGIAELFVGGATNLPALRHLELVGTGVSAATVTAFARGAFRLRRLDVRRNAIRDADVAGAPFARAGTR